MRTIDADALKELFSEVIGHIAKKPEMNGNLEHMIRASAMVIQMIDDAPSIQLGTNLAEVGTDLVSRQAVKDIFTELYGISAIGSVFDKYEWADICETTANELPSVQPDIIRCKDCEWWTKQENSIQGRCALHKMYPSGNWYCGTARRRGEQE